MELMLQEFITCWHFQLVLNKKSNVDTIVQKFLAENLTIMLFHYDGNVDGWSDLEWNKKAMHILLKAKPNGGLKNDFCIHQLCQFMNIYLFGIRIWVFRICIQKE
ncbi:hypothetical protein NMG60_11033729 [Bertholletia excelsa]